MNILLTESKDDKTNYMILDNRNITSINNTYTIFYNIEFLSLKNNCLINLNFLRSFPKLWYLDVRNNQVKINLLYKYLFFR